MTPAGVEKVVFTNKSTYPSGVYDTGRRGEVAGRDELHVMRDV